MDEKRNKVIVGVVITVVVIGLVLLFVMRNSANCELSEVEPGVDLKNSKNVKSSDKRALVSFIGYLTYLKDDKAKDPKKIFLPLNFESVSVQDTTGDNIVKGTIKLETDCAKLNFDYKTFDTAGVTGKGISVQDIEISLTLPNGDFKSCKVTDDTKIVRTNPKNYYSCEIKKEYDCKVDKKVVVKLTLGLFKLQLDGDKEKTGDLEFSGKPETCS